MTEQEISDEEAQPENSGIDEDTQEIIDSLNPRIELGDEGKEPKIFFDGDSLGNTIKNLKTRQEGVSIENSCLGLNMSMVSRNIPADKLMDIVIEKMLSLINRMPTRRPAGVD